MWFLLVFSRSACFFVRPVKYFLIFNYIHRYYLQFFLIFYLDIQNWNFFNQPQSKKEKNPSFFFLFLWIIKKIFLTEKNVFLWNFYTFSVVVFENFFLYIFILCNYTLRNFFLGKCENFLLNLNCKKTKTTKFLFSFWCKIKSKENKFFS